MDDISLETSLYCLSKDIVRFKIEVEVEEKYTKMLTPFPMDFPHTPEHAVIIDDVIIVGRLHSLINYDSCPTSRTAAGANFRR